MARKRNNRVPIHSMADEPQVRYEDIAVELPNDRDGIAALLEAEVLREYDVMGDDDAEGAAAPLVSVPPIVQRVTPAPETDDLSGPAQDEIVDGLEELKEMAEQVAAAGPKECPTCHRPFVAATLGKDGEETKSSKIRRMAAAGAEKGTIARTLGISYQFVHNVLSRPVRSA
jgi:hypothetical protein